jgi:hypothetical protein
MIRRPTSHQLRRSARCIIVKLERQPLRTSLRIPHLPKENLCLAVLVTLFILCTPRVVVAQTVKQLVADACYNARQQLEHETLWSSRVQRRAKGHVYLEEEIETVDGPVRRLISVDGREPSPSERKVDDERLRRLAENPNVQRSWKQNQETDKRKFGTLLQEIPDVFLFIDQGTQDGMERIAFRPNPSRAPKTYEERVLHALSGFIVVNLEETRLAGLSATLEQQVDFGYGVIGRLDKGGSINITRVRVSPGVWKTASFKIDMAGRIALFKTISRQQDETRDNFQPIDSHTTIDAALRQLTAANQVP